MSADTDRAADGQEPTTLRQCADALGQVDVVVGAAVHTSLTRCAWVELVWETDRTDEREEVDPDVRRVIGEYDCRVTETVACDGYAMASVRVASASAADEGERDRADEGSRSGGDP